MDYTKVLYLLDGQVTKVTFSQETVIALTEPFHFVERWSSRSIKTIKKKRALSEPSLNNNDYSCLVQMSCSRLLWESKVVMVTDDTFSLLKVKIESTQGLVSLETFPSKGTKKKGNKMAFG